MNSIVLAGTVPYVRQLHEFTSVDQWGASIAHQDILEAVLRHDAVDALHIFVETHSGHLGQEPGSLRLQREYGTDRVLIASPHKLREFALNTPYVFLTAGPPFYQISQARAALDIQLPICCIVHTVPSAQAAPVYLTTLLTSEPGDVLMVTSVAGHKAIRTLIGEARDFVKERFKTVISDIETVQVPLGVDTERLWPVDRHLARKILGLKQSHTVLLFVGRVTESYKADLIPLLLALRRLVDEDKQDAVLVIAGREHQDGYLEALKRSAAALGLGNRCVCITNFPSSLKPILYSSANVFVSPADNIQETFGLVVLEAMACGVPVVGSDWSGYRDLISHGITGFLVPTLWDSQAADEINALGTMFRSGYAEHYLAQHTIVDSDQLYRYIRVLCANPDLAAGFGRHALARVTEMYSWQVVTRQMRAVWQEQRNVSKSTTRRAKTPLPDYDQVFGHFATKRLHAGLALVACEGADEVDRAINGSRSIRASADKTTSLLKRCAQSPTTEAELVAEFGGDALPTVRRLLKKGILQFASDKTEERACCGAFKSETAIL